MDQGELRAFEGKCSQEEQPACRAACPLHVDGRAFAGFMAEGRVSEARKALDRSMPLPELLGRLCEGPCIKACRREERGGGVNMPLLERYCVIDTSQQRPMVLPGGGQKAHVLGAGLSSLVAAWDLSRKGVAVTLHYWGQPGGRLLGVEPERLGPEVLAEALGLLRGLRVEFARAELPPAKLIRWTAAQVAKDEDCKTSGYIGVDDPFLADADLEMETGPDNLIRQSPITLGTQWPGLFAGGEALAGAERTFIGEAADGRRGAASMDRFMQNVDPASAREKEGPQPCRLDTDLSSVIARPPFSAENPFNPTLSEAKAEASRCIKCECLMCVRKCVYLAHYKGYPKKYAREVYNNLSVVHGLRQANTMTNSCAQCGLCATVCPNDADFGAYSAAAREEMVKARKMPPSAHEFALEDMLFSNSEEAAFYRPEPGRSESRRVFFPGCQLPASAPEQTFAAYGHLREVFKDQGGVGLKMGCCGAPALWAARGDLYEAAAQGLRQEWLKIGKPEFILACASCSRFFAEQLPEIPARSLWEVLAESKALPPGTRELKCVPALHDPCAIRHSPAHQKALRFLLSLAGQKYAELPLGRESTRCCGYGGLMQAANPDLALAMAESRANDTEATVLSYCIMCRDSLRRAGKPSLHIFDLLFPVRDVGVAPALRPAPGFSDRQESRARLRARFLREVWHEPDEEAAMDDTKLIISPEIQEVIDRRRILRSDIKSAILAARASGRRLVNKETGRYLICHKPRRVSFWVLYSPGQEPGSYVIHDAYNHRMHVPGSSDGGADD